MKLFVMFAALALSACTGVAPPSSPGQIADRTVIDEQAALSVELAYQSANLAVRTANRAGLLSPARKVQLAALDSRAYAAVQKVRLAYDTGNASSYASAVATARGAITELLNLAR